MGKVHFGAPPELCLRLRDAFGLEVFVETGTFRGNTAIWAGTHFKKVYTIEGWQDYYERTSQAHRDKPNIEFLFGDSRKKLPEVLKKLKTPALIWLDAHWMGDSMLSAGTDGECPLLDELEALGKRGVRHFILIDDLHCFLGELNKGADPSRWPSLEQIKDVIMSYFPDYYFITHEDVIIAAPSEAISVIEDHRLYPGIRVVVPTSNDYVGVLNGFGYCFNKFWSPQVPVTVVRYEVRPPKPGPNFSNVAVGKQADYTWCSGMVAYLKLPQAPRLFVLMLEDYYLSATVDMGRIQALWRYACEHDEVVKIDLTGDRLKFPHQPYSPAGDLELIRSEDDAAFRGSIQAAIWKKEYLLANLNPSWDAWQFEKHGCRDGALILGVSEPTLSYVNAVGGQGNKPGEYDHKKIPAWMWEELKGARLV